MRDAKKTRKVCLTLLFVLQFALQPCLCREKSTSSKMSPPQNLSMKIVIGLIV